MGFLLGIDQGTSGTTVLVLDPDLQAQRRATRPVASVATGDGGVEQNPRAVLSSVVESCGEALDGIGEPVDAVGFAHQGETVLAWESETLEQLTPAIVWSDRRSEMVTERMKQAGMANRIFELSGMRLDPYFCAAKYTWMLEQIPAVTARAESGGLQLGTLETWLLLQLGSTFETDIGTASRTQLTRLGESQWDADLLNAFGVAEEWLAPVGSSLGNRGELTHDELDVALPLRAVMVDQPAALVGNGCLDAGEMKVTYGTGAFVVANAGRARPEPQSSVIASVGWGDEQGPVYVLDGGVLSVGSALDWLAGLGIDVRPEAHQRLAGRAPSSLLVKPALNGTGAPRWDRNDTASLLGITAGTTGDDLLHAFLDSFAFRVREVVDAMAEAGIPRPTALRVDGGLTRSAYLMQRQADVLGIPVAVAASDEATAVGIAAMAASKDQVKLLSDMAPSTTYIPAAIEATDEAFRRWSEVIVRGEPAPFPLPEPSH